MQQSKGGHFKMGKKPRTASEMMTDMIAITEENIAPVYGVVTDDRMLTVNRIANTVGISHELVEKILHY